ncbi:MAG: Hsp20/alpha crystallin family protein [Lentisphaeria bacterium]|jgi:HSP20 family protein|nr:Hsp20/alpha crystallin family protein [Lentisphaeria bacterium]
MLWTWPIKRHGSLWGELDRLQREFNQFMEPLARTGMSRFAEFPAVNIWVGEDNALLTAELPGIDPDKLEITVKNDTVTIRGIREAEKLDNGQTLIRQERGAGSFVRSFALPFHVDSERVAAQYQKGILQVVLPKPETEKPKKITVKAG